jgi:cytoskeletal protein RodZ
MAKRKKDNDETPPENQGQADDSAENFGLPEIEYQPLDRTETVHEETRTVSESVHEPEEHRQEPVYDASETREDRHNTMEFEDDEPRSGAPLVIGAVIIIVIAAAGFLLYRYWYVPRAQKAKLELARVDAEKKKADEEARLAREKEEADHKRQEAEAAAKATPPAGTIETLGAATRRYYVIISSDIDGDLIMDYAKKLSAKGVSSKIIPAFGKSKYNRLAISDADTYNAAQATADASKANYGSAVWVMRY